MTEDTKPYKVEVVAPIFPVTDVARSTAFYRDKLLFDVGFEWADSEAEPIRYAILQNGNTELHLSAAKEARVTVAYFFVDNVAAYYEAVQATGAPISEALADQPWEMREFEVTDPDGNRVTFGEHLSRI